MSAMLSLAVQAVQLYSCKTAKATWGWMGKLKVQNSKGGCGGKVDVWGVLGWNSTIVCLSLALKK